MVRAKQAHYPHLFSSGNPWLPPSFVFFILCTPFAVLHNPLPQYGILSSINEAREERRLTWPQKPCRGSCPKAEHRQRLQRMRAEAQKVMTSTLVQRCYLASKYTLTHVHSNTSVRLNLMYRTVIKHSVRNVCEKRDTAI